MSEAQDCEGCDVGNRREFILDALRASAAVAVALGLSADVAEALPVRFVKAVAGAGGEKSYPVPAADGVQIDKDNDLIIARVAKKVFAFDLACPHQNTALRWEAADNRFQCPKHKTTYTAEGVYIEGRATRSMDRHALRLNGATLVVDTDKVYQEDLNKAEWERAVVTV